MNRSKRDYLAAHISASSDPATYGNFTVLTIPGQANGPKLANNAIVPPDPAVPRISVSSDDNQNRIRWGNPVTLPVARGRAALRRTGLCIPGSQRRFVLPAADPGGDVQRQGGIPHGAGCAHRLVRARGRCDGGYHLRSRGSGITESPLQSTAACQGPQPPPDWVAPRFLPGRSLIAGQSCCAAGDQAAIGGDAVKKGDFAAYGSALQRLDEATPLAQRRR